jgi:Tfp pilus assembly protein PilV
MTNFTVSPSRHARGFTLPSVMVVTAALLLLVVGLLAVVSIEKKTASSYSDSKRAELAARAGLEDFRTTLINQTANDDYLVIGQSDDTPKNKDLSALPYLYAVRGKAADDTSYTYSYHPLFSTTDSSRPPDTSRLSVPTTSELVPNTDKAESEAEEPDSALAKFQVHPWQDKAHVAWKNIKDEKGRITARYAYWVEDLQGKADVVHSGNNLGTGNAPRLVAYPFPAPGVSDRVLADGYPRLDQLSWHIFDSSSTETKPSTDFTKKIIDGRKSMLSPDSILGATGYSSNEDRDAKTGILTDVTAAKLEMSTSTVCKPYKERPTVPYATGISSAVAGQPKKNLNELLLKSSRSTAVSDFASWVEKAYPKFATKRKGGFADDYLKTLAANAFDYADSDNEPTIGNGYRGLDGYPLISEIVVLVNYTAPTPPYSTTSPFIMKLDVTLFCELWNMTNKPVSGTSQLSYEVGLKSNAIGSGVAGAVLDSPQMLASAKHDLTKGSDGLYWTQPINVNLKPDEYKFYQYAKVSYSIDTGVSTSQATASNSNIDLIEEQDTRGLSQKWNNQLVERIAKITRIPFFSTTVKTSKVAGSAHIAAHSFGIPTTSTYWNNMGDPRMSNYLKNRGLSANAYPSNISPNRRNIRRSSIYDLDGVTKPKFYGRVLPSEWADGGHDSQVGSWTIETNPAGKLPTDSSYTTPVLDEKNAPTRLSNLGRFYSASELGRVYDPIMWTQTYKSTTDTATMALGNIPSTQHQFPDVIVASEPTLDYGGGNTLRIGRPEHPRFDEPGLRAAGLLDIFTAGESTSKNQADWIAPTMIMKGAVNVNTADRDTLRALAAGILAQDPGITQVTTWNHKSSPNMAPQTASGTLKLGAPTTSEFADKVADGIIKSRPFAGSTELSAAATTPKAAIASNDTNDTYVFGSKNKKMYDLAEKLQWNDSAAEELFARVNESVTMRSRNFRIWVIGQALEPYSEGSQKEIHVISESKKSFTVFADPGERNSSGEIQTSNYHPKVTYENDF